LFVENVGIEGQARSLALHKQEIAVAYVQHQRFALAFRPSGCSGDKQNGFSWNRRGTRLGATISWRWFICRQQPSVNFGFFGKKRKRSIWGALGWETPVRCSGIARAKRLTRDCHRNEIKPSSNITNATLRKS